MFRFDVALASCVAVTFALSLPACGSSGSGDAPPASTDDPPGGAPAAPPMPDGWKITKDVDVPRSGIAPIEKQLSGSIKAMRNTSYEVDGQRVQLNSIVATDSAAADAIYRSLATMKPPYAIARQGDTIFELVGPNEATESIKKAHALLQPGEAK